MVYIPVCKQQLKNYEIIHVDTRYCTLQIWAILPESRVIINYLDVILHDFVLQIIYSTVFRVKRLNIITLRIRLFNFYMENCSINITSKLILDINNFREAFFSEMLLI